MTVRLVPALLLLSTAAPAAAQTLGQGDSVNIPWFRLTAALILCVGLAAGAALALRRRLGQGGPAAPAVGWSRLLAELAVRGAAAGPPRLTDIETRRLSPQVTVSVFRCDGRSYMVAASHQGQLVLVNLDPGPSGAEE